MPLRLIPCLLLIIALFPDGSPAADLHPIVELENSYLLGASANGKWISGEKGAPLIKAGTPYRCFSFTSEVGKATGGKPKSTEEVCPDTYSVQFSTEAKSAIMAIAASWNPMPRAPRDADTTQEVYVAAVRDFLIAHGLPKPAVKMKRIVRVDLDGDGEDEVLVNATNYPNSDMSSSATAGSYSIVLLRRVVNGKVETQMVAGEIYPKAKEFNAPNEYKILAFLDCDGDGKLEVILKSAYYEGDATTVYQLKGRKMEEVLSVGCGA